jgi:hypothetical protein
VSTASKIARILELLNDSQWHTLDEVQKKTELNRDQLQQVIAFFKEYQFIVTSDTKGDIRLREDVRRFLTQNVTS